MDVICLVRQNETLQQPKVEALGMGEYLLIRIELNLGLNRWFDVPIEKPFATFLQEQARKENSTVKGPNKRTGKFQFRRSKKHISDDCRQEAEQQRTIQVEEYCARKRYVRDALRGLAGQIRSMPEPDSKFRIVYDRELAWLGRPEAAEIKVLAQMWQKYFPFPEFWDYTTPEWMERLAPEAPNPYVLILGTGVGIYKVLEKHARKLKEVRWILFREDYDRVFQNFAEEFYSDSGLAIRYHVITDVSYLAEEGVRCTERTTVYDFTGPLYVNVKEMAPGSTWLDVYSRQTKWEQIRPFSEGPKRTCEYRSLYKIWTEKQKKYNRPYFLDSIEENGYNTLETVGARGY